MKKRKQNKYHVNGVNLFTRAKDSLEYRLWCDITKEIGYLLWNGNNCMVFRKFHEMP